MRTLTAAIKGRPAQETLESLRLTLLKVEQTAEPDHDQESLAELKRILLQRIAELEALHALESAAAADPGADQTPDNQTPGNPDSAEPKPADVIPPTSMTAGDSKDVAAGAEVLPPPAEPNTC